MSIENIKSFDTQEAKIDNKSNIEGGDSELITGLKEQLERINIIKDYSGSAGKHLHNKLSPEDRNDPESKQTFELLEKYKNQYTEATKDGEYVTSELQKLSEELHIFEDSLEYSKGIDMDDAGKISKLRISQEELNSMSNRDFLKIPESERLQYVTVNHTDVEKIIFGDIKNIEFTFDQDGDGKDNKELFRLTTAGQVLPDVVREVSSNGVNYFRSGLNGEFFTKDGVRLKIYTGTNIEISSIGTPNELQDLKYNNTQKYNEFLARGNNSVEYSDNNFTEIVNVAIEKGLEPEIFIGVVERRVETFEKNSDIDNVTLEVIATEISRQLSGLNMKLIDGKYSLDSAANIFREVTPTTWKQNLKDYGYDIDTVNNYEKENPDNFKYDFGKLNNYIPSEYSSPVERSSSGTTLCSKTARLNLSRLGVEGDINRGNSAKESFNMYSGDISNFPPSEESGAIVADFYLDASSKNAEYGHRVAAFKDGGNWYVLDPYYDIVKGVDNRLPVLAETYISTMSAKGRKMWGAHYFS